MSSVSKMKNIALFEQSAVLKELAIPSLNTMEWQKPVLLHEAFMAVDEVAYAIWTPKVAIIYSALITFPITWSTIWMKQEL